MRLWHSESTPLDQAVLSFTVGDDFTLDQELLPFDCLGSAAHAMMLAEIGIIEEGELPSLLEALSVAYKRSLAGEFPIEREQEDCHTALEEFLTESVGETGKKIHTGRSRNDQVIMALRLMVRDRVLSLLGSIERVVRALLVRSQEHERTLMPGFTHTRQAMPSTAGQLFAATAEGLIRDAEALLGPIERANRSALGSASGYGVPVALDRERVAELLGLDGIDLNTLHVQNTRGRLEAAVLSALHQLSLTFSRLATDLIWFSSETFGMFSLPKEITTGSSIMPQKRNPDLLELVRAIPSSMLGRYVEVTGLLHGLPSGYHRDLQRTKSPILLALRETEDVLTIMGHAIERLEFDAERCAEVMQDEIFATDAAYDHLRDGVSFRDAYRMVKEQGSSRPDAEDVLRKRTHLGAPGTPQDAWLLALWGDVDARFERFRDGAVQARSLLS